MNILKLNIRLTCFEKQFFRFFSTNPSCNIQCFHSVGLLSALLLPGFPGDASGKEPTCQWSWHKRHGFNPWIRKISWRRAWHPTVVFLPGESCLDRGAWRATVHRVEQSWTQLKRLSTHTCKHALTPAWLPWAIPQSWATKVLPLAPALTEAYLLIRQGSSTHGHYLSSIHICREKGPMWRLFPHWSEACHHFTRVSFSSKLFFSSVTVFLL